MKLTIVAAVAENDVIGCGDLMPWHVPEEMQHFQNYTMGKVVVMGYRTAKSLRGPLKGRTNIVVTDRGCNLPGFIWLANKHECLSRLSSVGEIIIAGGRETYIDFLPYANKMLLSHMKNSRWTVGDVKFPTELVGACWQRRSLEEQPCLDEFEVVEYTRYAELNP